MTPEEHKARHIELHRSLDELFADFIDKGVRSGEVEFTQRPIMDLIQWSYRQTQSPDHKP